MLKTILHQKCIKLTFNVSLYNNNSLQNRMNVRKFWASFLNCAPKSISRKERQFRPFEVAK